MGSKVRSQASNGPRSMTRLCTCGYRCGSPESGIRLRHKSACAHPPASFSGKPPSKFNSKIGMKFVTLMPPAKPETPTAKAASAIFGKLKSGILLLSLLPLSTGVRRTPFREHFSVSKARLGFVKRTIQPNAISKIPRRHTWPQPAQDTSSLPPKNSAKT